MGGMAGAAIIVYVAMILFGLVGLVAVFVIRSAFSFLVLLAFGRSGGGPEPLTTNRCCGIAAVRTVLEAGLLGALYLMAGTAIESRDTTTLVAAWGGLCAARGAVWCALGLICDSFRGRKLFALVALGLASDILCDAIVLFSNLTP